MIVVPSIDEQKQFIVLFMKSGDPSTDFSKIIAEMKNLSAAEIKRTAVSLVPLFLDMGWSEERINEALLAENLPAYASFKKLNAKHITKILRKKKITSDSDILLLKDALENSLLIGEEKKKAEMILASLDL